MCVLIVISILNMDIQNGTEISSLWVCLLKNLSSGLWDGNTKSN